MYNTHVYLGPSLDLKIAQEIFPKAHYHPPIQCGDLLQLLRLCPKKVIIIDGLYESVPAVWHKEILIAIGLGIEVWGAASMGALRAAELDEYGMQGYGQVYHDFKMKILNDDDEVAVLHRGSEGCYVSINDAMVNIRATCEEAYRASVLTMDQKNQVIDHCKHQFYPYRSLRQTLQMLGFQEALVWLEKQGMIDVKQQDAVGVLTYHRDRVLLDVSVRTTITSHLTIFIRELLSSVEVMPFRGNAGWLPDIEKKLQTLHGLEPQQYMLIAEVAYFFKKLSVASSDEAGDVEALLTYIKQHDLYKPVLIQSCCSKMPTFNQLYYQLCKMICAKKLTAAMVQRYRPVIAHYYDLDATLAIKNESLLEVLFMMVWTISGLVYENGVKILDDAMIHHCQDVKRRRNYTVEQFQQWFNPDHISPTLLKNFIVHYFVTLRGTFHRCRGMLVYPWIYDAYRFYTHHVLEVQSCHEQNEV